MSGRKVELDEVIVPSLELESSTSVKSVPVMPTPTREEANDDDDETSNQVTTEPHRPTRVRSTPEWYGNPILEVMLLDHDEPTNYEVLGNIACNFKIFLRSCNIYLGDA